MNTFDFIGKIRPFAESETFKPYTAFESDSGWLVETLKFGCDANGSNHFLTLKSVIRKDGSNVIRTLSKDMQPLSVPFADRQDPKYLKEVVGFKKFVLDFTEPKTKDGDEEPKSRRREYISSYDLLHSVQSMLNKESYKDRIFQIKGTIETSIYNGKTYYSLEPTSIKLVDSSTPEKSEGYIKFYFDDEAWEDAEDNGKNIVKGYVDYYNSSLKSTAYAPYTLVVKNSEDPERGERINRIRKRYFSNDTDNMKVIGVVVNLFSGTEVREISEDDLTEEQKDAIFCGDITLEEIQSAGQVAGNNITENQFIKLMKKYSGGAEETTITLSEVMETMAALSETKAEAKTEKKAAAKSSDFFDDDDDDVFDLSEDYMSF